MLACVQFYLSIQILPGDSVGFHVISVFSTFPKIVTMFLYIIHLLPVNIMVIICKKAPNVSFNFALYIVAIDIEEND